MDTCFHKEDALGVFWASHKTIFGNRAIESLPAEAKKLGAGKVLVVTDEGLVRAGLVEPVAQSLQAEGLAVTIFDKVPPEPPARVVDECADMARREGCDLVVGFGGGSPLDAAKAAAFLIKNPGSVLDYAGQDQVPEKGAPIIMVPTTAGTGSEASRVLVFTDEANNTKNVVYSDHILAEVAILDPGLTLSMPQAVTADSGIDALVHAVEAFVSVHTTPYAEILALQAIGMIAANLPRAYCKGGDLEARYNMLLAANLAGAAFTSGGLGAVHGLAYVLGTEYHMAHGLSNAIMLPHVMQYSLYGNLPKFARIAEAMGEPIAGLSPYEAAAKAVEAVQALLKMLDISANLVDHGIEPQDVPKLVEGGLAQSRLFNFSPRDLTAKDLERIYTSAFQTA